MSDQPDKGGDGSAAGEAPEASPADQFKQGMGLLWQAARATVDEIKHEVEKGGVGDSLKQAGRDLEQAANQAAKTIESFIDRVGPHETPPEQQGWPGAPPDAGNAAPPPAPAPDHAPDDAAAPDEAAPPREGDMRIQIDDD